MNTGSRRYMAPEVAKGERYNLTSDVYSFAILLLQMCTLQKPYEEYTHEQHLNLVLGMGRRPCLDRLNHGVLGRWPKEMKGLMERCWCQDLQERVGVEVVVEELLGVYTTMTKGGEYVCLE